MPWPHPWWVDIFPSLLAYERFLDVGVAGLPEEGLFDLGTPTLSLIFERGADLPSSMRREATRQGWPVAGPKAYPWVQHRDRDGLLMPLTEKDVLIVSACATSLATFFLKHGGIFFSTPEFVCMVNNQSGEIEGFIETCVRGIPLTLFKNSIHEDKIIPSIAEVAAAVHQVPPANFPHLVAYPDNRTHIFTELESLPKEVFDEYDIAQTAKRFVFDHIPKAKPAVLVHGDLLPQNLICGEDDSGWRTSVIDWEFARIGDPAYDLSIVTRGDRKLAGKKNGLNLLLTFYREAGGLEISQSDFHIHELILALNWLWESTIKRRKGHNGHGPDFYLEKIESILRRIEKAGN